MARSSHRQRWSTGGCTPPATGRTSCVPLSARWVSGSRWVAHQGQTPPTCALLPTPPTSAAERQAASGGEVLLPHLRHARHGDVHEDRRRRRGGLVLRVHVRLLRQPVALAAVARRAARNDVVPRRRAALRTRDHVVHRQRGVARAAVLTG